MGILDYFRSDKTVAPEESKKTIGRSGTINTQGFILSRDVNDLFVSPTLYDTVEEMERTDSSIKWALSMITTPIRALSWAVEPASEDEKDVEIAAFVEHCLFKQLEGGWDEFIRQALLYPRDGCSVFERVMDYGDIEFFYTSLEGEEVEFSKPAFFIKKLSHRLPRTLQRWVPRKDDPDSLSFIEQWLEDGSASSLQLPAERLVIFTHDQRGSDWRGQSILRSTYASWSYKAKLEALEAMGLERS